MSTLVSLPIIRNNDKKPRSLSIVTVSQNSLAKKYPRIRRYEMIIDWTRRRKALLVTLACLALVALTSCGGGGDGGGGPGVIITPPSTTSPPTTPPPGARGVLVSGTSGCSTPVHMRFFQYRTRSVSSLAGQWPGGNNVYVISPGGTHQRTLACRPGYMVCYGGRNPANNRFWGAGIDGREVCTNCCTTCPSSGSRNLSFGSLQCTGGGWRWHAADTRCQCDGIPSSCSREVEVCVRDNECEDGDQVRVSVNSSVVFSGEIVNECPMSNCARTDREQLD